jgi:hypothetical protein
LEAAITDIIVNQSFCGNSYIQKIGIIAGVLTAG